MSKITRFVRRIKADGIQKGFIFIIDTIRTKRRSAAERNLPRFSSLEKRFTQIYKYNFWGSTESISGPGSELVYTANLRDELPRLIELFSIKSVFDAPCGDLNWMGVVLPRINIRYIGADIVKKLIIKHKKLKLAGATFIHQDITVGPFPQCDLMICRDCLFHLSYADTYKILKNFLNSGTRYLLTTTHVGDDFTNVDVATGGFKKINLFSHPYHFSNAPLYTIVDYLEPSYPRHMCLWSADQVRSALSTSCDQTCQGLMAHG